MVSIPENTGNLRVYEADRFGDAGRAVLAFDLDRDFVRHLHAGALGFGADQLLAGADAGADGHHVGEADFVRAVVDAAADAVDARDLGGEHRDQRERQIAVGDGAAGRQLALGALDVDMDPLMVAGRVSEFVDAVLVDLDPFADAELFADVLGDVGVFDRLHGFGPSLFDSVSARTRVWMSSM